MLQSQTRKLDLRSDQKMTWPEPELRNILQWQTAHGNENCSYNINIRLGAEVAFYF